MCNSSINQQREERMDKQQQQQRARKDIGFKQEKGNVSKCSPLVAKKEEEDDASVDGRTMLFNLESSRLYRSRRNNGSDNGTTVPSRCDLTCGHGKDGKKSISLSPQSTSAEGAINAATLTSRHYTLPAMPASCSLLESYVTGTGSPLRNLYCQCKHHHDSTE